MAPLDCRFCDHENPAGAKFCNECGSPLHLAPCKDCGAVNNLTDPHCWRCGGLLLPPSPRPPGDVDRDSAVIDRQLTALVERQYAAPERDPGALEQELVALEQQVQGLGEVAKGDEPRPGRLERAFQDSNIPDPRSLFVAADDAPYRRRHGLLATAFVVALGSAIAVGAYLRNGDGTSPASTAAPAPPFEPRADASTAPRAAPDVAATPAAVPEPATSLAPKGVDAAVERRVANDAGEAPAAAPEPACPPAVAAMALCDWLVQAKR